MMYKNGQDKKWYYFTPIQNNVAAGQVCDVHGGAVEKTAKLWGKCNGFEKVFVYDLYHKFVGEYESLA